MRDLFLCVFFCLSMVGSARAVCATSGTTVSATSLAFSTINPFVLPDDTTATLTMVYKNSGNACTESTAVVTLSVGAGTGATAANRKMTSGANTINYTIYTNSARTTVWDNVTGLALPSITVPRHGTATQTATMYGRVFSGQSNAAIGSYTDTVTITLTY